MGLGLGLQLNPLEPQVVPKAPESRWRDGGSDSRGGSFIMSCCARLMVGSLLFGTGKQHADVDPRERPPPVVTVLFLP